MPVPLLQHPFEQLHRSGAKLLVLGMADHVQRHQDEGLARVDAAYTSSLEEPLCSLESSPRIDFDRIEHGLGEIHVVPLGPTDLSFAEHVDVLSTTTDCSRASPSLRLP